MKVLVNVLDWDTQTDHVVKTSHVGYVLCKQYGFHLHRFFVCVFPPISPLDLVWTKQVWHEDKGLTSYNCSMFIWEE